MHTVVLSTSLASPIIINISDVDISPEIPSILDTIDVTIDGGASGSNSQVEYTEFSQNGTSLQLDLFINIGILAVLSTWSHIEQVDPFAADVYTLTIRAFEYQDNTLKDTHVKEFTVIPEPTTISLRISARTHLS